MSTIFSYYVLLNCSNSWLHFSSNLFSEHPRFCNGLLSLSVQESIRITTLYDIILSTNNISVMPSDHPGCDVTDFIRGSKSILLCYKGPHQRGWPRCTWNHHHGSVEVPIIIHWASTLLYFVFLSFLLKLILFFVIWIVTQQWHF